MVTFHDPMKEEMQGALTSLEGERKRGEGEGKFLSWCRKKGGHRLSINFDPKGKPNGNNGVPRKKRKNILPCLKIGGEKRGKNKRLTRKWTSRKTMKVLRKGKGGEEREGIHLHLT